MPEVGDRILYTLSEDNAKQINKRRKDARNLNESGKTLASQETGAVIHSGNEVKTGDVFPGVLVRKWSDDGFNAQVSLDGNDIFWACSIGAGEGPYKFQVIS